MPLSLRSVARQAFHSFGGVSLVRFRTRHLPRVLMYHRFPPGDAAEELERQCAHIRRHYHPISVEDLREWLLEGRPLAENAVLITVDDGYEDFYQNALPVLSRYGIPSVVFAVTDFVDRKLWLWFDKVDYAFRRTGVTRVKLVIHEAQALDLSLGSTEERTAGKAAFLGLVKRLPNEQRLRAVEQLPAQLEVTLPEQAPPEYAPMSWPQILNAASQGVTFGAHTCTHPILSRLASSELLHREIFESKRRLEEKLQKPATVFAYPNGRADDVNDVTLEMTKRSGFCLAFGTNPGLVRRSNDPFFLPRIGMEPESALYFFQQMAGFRVRSR